nr:immunoglobulin heavy chain junction region [Macaca mulatta]
CAKKEDDFDYL